VTATSAGTFSMINLYPSMRLTSSKFFLRLFRSSFGGKEPACAGEPFGSRKPSPTEGPSGCGPFYLDSEPGRMGWIIKARL